MRNTVSKNSKNRFAQPETAQTSAAQSPHADAPPDERALVPLADGVELPEAGTYIFQISDDGEITHIEPMLEEARPGQSPDIVVFCPDKGRKCVAEFEVKRKETGEVRLVCKECVGPSRENEYQRML